MQLLLTDLDETLRMPASGSKFIQEPHDQQIMKDTAQAILMWLKARSMGNSEATKIIGTQSATVIGISNQGGVPKHKSLEDCIKEQRYTIKLLAEEGIQIDSIYICIDFEGDVCYRVSTRSLESIGYGGYINVPSQLKFSVQTLKGKFRKPNGGMLTAARLTQNSHPEECLYIGDREEDEQAAINANIPFLHVSKFQDIYRSIEK